MHLLRYTFGLVALAGCMGAAATPAAAQLRPEIEAFIGEMVNRHGFNQAELESILVMAQFQPAILNAISQPATSRPWYEFRTLFVNPRRIAGGVAFWNSHAETLERARREFGIPEEIITAVIGVETLYGAQAGKHRVLDALTTLAFDYPKRAQFFRGELEQYLLLGKDQNADVLNIKGSYAGAIGIPQFMPSSYRRYAVDYDNDGRIDLSGSTTDAIGSVANYLKSHGWQMGEAVAVPALVNSENYRAALFTGNWPTYTVADLRTLGIASRVSMPGNPHATLIELENNGGNEYWLGFNNFFVITRYNRSVNYAMSVLELAKEIYAARNSSLR
ncbi:lytic murein transglycosylase B [Nitrosovibrio tenuis]|uniref:Membrane-bound lytic murein transglycosylase B n=1 Tax=Nitrosovibrio tenuis TaxID=1233 RepID=A0A1H7H6H8_9PROT|nr:lytic murein transglycosylase B [Nitrosovibrio tenuis]SEK45367.1 membrane-bound lytic murein transglycosylase B [Nitrosovibrio tenuis]